MASANSKTFDPRPLEEAIKKWPLVFISDGTRGNSNLFVNGQRVMRVLALDLRVAVGDKPMVHLEYLSPSFTEDGFIIREEDGTIKLKTEVVEF